MAITKKSKPSPSWLTEVRADRDEWVELLGTTPSDKTLEHVGLSRRKWADILSGKCPSVSMACYRLASFCRHGCLADLLGSAWSDFFVRGDALVFPGLKYPLSAPDLRAAWVRIQDAARLRSEVSHLRAELDHERKCKEDTGFVFDWRLYADAPPVHR